MGREEEHSTTLTRQGKRRLADDGTCLDVLVLSLALVFIASSYDRIRPRQETRDNDNTRDKHKARSKVAQHQRTR